MAYQSRKRNYKTAKERYERDKRNLKVAALFITLALLVWGIMNRQDLYDWSRTFFIQ